MTSLLAKTAKLAGLSKVRLSSAVQSEAGPSSGKKQVVYEVIHLPAVATNSARPKEAEAVNNENKDPVKKKTEEENDTSEAVKDQSQPAEIYVPQSSVEGYFKKIVHLFKFIHFNLQNIDKKLDNSEKAKPAAESNDYTILAHFIPVNNIESINHFEMLIATDRDAVSQFKKMLTQTGGRSVKDSVYRSLRKIFTNACAIQCSWQGRKNNFRVSDLSFMQIMKETFCTTFPHITEAEFETIAAEWFRFAKQRLIREESRMMSKADPLQFDQN